MPRLYSTISLEEALARHDKIVRAIAVQRLIQEQLRQGKIPNDYKNELMLLTHINYPKRLAVITRHLSREDRKEFYVRISKIREEMGI